MLVVDLHCENGHAFEGWFASGDDLAAQQARGLLACPVCGANKVVRRPSAPHLNVASLKATPAAPRRPRGAPASASTLAAPTGQGPHGESAPQSHGNPEHAEAAVALQALYFQAVRHVLDNTEDVGQRFVQEVRGMHHGDVPERAIRGQATPEERAELKEEGIDVMSLPVPAFMKPKDSLQ